MEKGRGSKKKGVMSQEQGKRMRDLKYIISVKNEF